MEVGGVAAASVASGRFLNEIYKPVDRTVTVFINNDLERVLENPIIHTLNGELYTIAEDIKPHSQATAIFREKPFYSTGVIGAITYTIRGTGLKATVYFENPTVGERMFGVRWNITENEIENSDLRNWKRNPTIDMWVVGKKLGTKKKEMLGFVVKVFMTNSSHTQMKITFTESDSYLEDDTLTGSHGYENYGGSRFADRHYEDNRDHDDEEDFTRRGYENYGGSRFADRHYEDNRDHDDEEDFTRRGYGNYGGSRFADRHYEDNRDHDDEEDFTRRGYGNYGGSRFANRHYEDNRDHNDEEDFTHLGYGNYGGSRFADRHYEDNRDHNDEEDFTHLGYGNYGGSRFADRHYEDNRDHDDEENFTRRDYGNYGGSHFADRHYEDNGDDDDEDFTSGLRNHLVISGKQHSFLAL